MTSLLRTIACFGMGMALLAGCAGAGIQVQVDVVRGDLERARAMNATTCAPRAFAMAESHVDFAQVELTEGDFVRAGEHVDIAVANVRAALKDSEACAPKRIVIASDTDADTIPDGVDRCPTAAGPVENEGCPLADRDGDGVIDTTDACPDAAEDKDGDADADGRPELDADQDGVVDCVPGCPSPAGQVCDACPTEPEDRDGFQDDDGCPDLDNDGDGVPDTDDECPAVTGAAAVHGCPDGDGDGIADAEDKCPTEVGVLQPDVPDRSGCPKAYALIVVKKDKIEIKQQVLFDSGKAVIKPGSFALLAEVGDAIRSSSLTRVLIDGHTDDVGDDAVNLKLSRDRADAVRQRLIDVERIDGSALVATGYGETRPVASNRTKAGKQQNRRVEFTVER